MANLIAIAAPLADAAKEGKKVIGAMLIVALIFVSVVVVGETFHYFRHTRHYRP